MRTGCELVLAIGVPATVGMALLAEPIAGVLLGEQFRQSAALVIPWIALAGLLRGFKLFYLDHAFHLGKRTGLALNTVWFPAVLNIALNVLLIPRFGILGAVYATVASFAVAALLSWYLGRRAFAVPLPVAPVVKAVAACVPMALVVLVLDPAAELWALSGAVLAGGVAYGIGAFVLDIARCRTFAMQYLRS